MTIEEALGKISKALALFAYETRAQNLGGLYSKNKLVEDLLLPVFRIVFGAPKLRNVNEGKTNFPYIDLVDDGARLAIQVTTERPAKKVTETLIGFVKQGYQEQYDHLVIFVLTDRDLSYNSKSIKNWGEICTNEIHFDPRSDIITTPRLLPLIQGLPHEDIYKIHDIIARSVIGEAYIDVDQYLRRLCSRQLENEKKSGKYIPDIFVETRETKNLARIFSHPALFFHRTLDSLKRLNIDGANSILAKAGLPPLPFPDLSGYGSVQLIADVGAAALNLSAQLGDLTSVVEKYHKITWKGPPPFEVQPERRYYYDESIFTLQQVLGFGLRYRIEGLLNELKAAQARVFILTGRAGQGKTNLVCDFVENFLFKHRIPCAYLTGRLLRAYTPSDIGETMQKMFFEGRTASFAEAAQVLSDYADRSNKPFVLIIDGLNEHHRISEFADQLERLIESAISYPHLKLFLTCRSEFYEQRFGGLNSSSHKPYTFLLESNELRLDEESYAQVLSGYFKFFGIRRDLVSDNAIGSLKQDLLLLRFFCEAYGSRNKPSGYQQPIVRNIYRDDIFGIYLGHKLDVAEGFFERRMGKEKMTKRGVELVRVMECCLEHMLRTWQFSNVPVSTVPGELDDALSALLDEELILRRDAPQAPSVFSHVDEMINFTFDDFRDFLLAQYLLYRVYPTDRPKFEDYIARNDPKDSQIVEGLKKFLFYASRQVNNTDFWKYYRNLPWYADVYDSEVFSIDPDLLRAEDRDFVVGVLNDGGHRAERFAGLLAVRWHPSVYRVLNLDLLISVVTQDGDTKYDALIKAAFKTHPHFPTGHSASDFCEFISEHILQEFMPGANAPENGLFRFLILLLPVDSGVGLESKSFQTFRNLLALHSAYAINLLKESLLYKPTRHRPYVWRLLALVPAQLAPDDLLFDQARKEQAQSASGDPLLYREVTRFLDRCEAIIEQS